MGHIPNCEKDKILKEQEVLEELIIKSDDYDGEWKDERRAPELKEMVPPLFNDEKEDDYLLAEEQDASNIYFGQLERLPLLSPFEEKTLGKIIKNAHAEIFDLILKLSIKDDEELKALKRRINLWQKGRNKANETIDKLISTSKEVFSNLMKRFPDDEELKEHYKEFLRCENKLQEAVNRLVSGNLRLAVSIAKRFRNRGVSFADLIQEANIGLIKAAHRFDYRKGYRFSTFASWWIKQAIIRSIYEHSRTIRIPVHYIELRNKFYKTFYALFKDLGRTPTPAEICQESDLPLDKVKELMTISFSSISLETPVGNDKDEIGHLIEDESVRAADDLISEREKERLTEEVLNLLSEREKKIIQMRFGIGSDRRYTLEEVGNYFSLSRERIRQIEKRALRKLRHPARKRRLMEFLS